jgi:hypothetical protein|tara:strand:+ start:4398 stop:5048 length:651 start_codon:yes stop_codon:yes gene_type:complete
MKLKIAIPNSLDDITLSQYKRFIKIQEQTENARLLNAKMIEIFCSTKLEEVMRLKLSDTEEIVSILGSMFEQKPDLVRKFNINNTDFGFHPQLDDLSLGEYIDLDTYIGDWDNMERAMNVLYRPITASLKEQYSIVDYKTELNPAILHMPMSAVLSSIFFLWNLGLDLSKVMTNSLADNQTEILTEYLTSQGSGVGINQFMVSLKEILQDLKVSLN